MKPVIIIAIAVVLLIFVPTLANGDEYAEKWKQYVESYKGYMETYKAWAHDTINYYKSQLFESNKSLEILKDENRVLKQDNKELKNQVKVLRESYEDYVEEVKTYVEGVELYNKAIDDYQQKIDDYQQEVEKQSKVPQTTITKEEVQLKLFDSKGNQYNWVVPIETYESYVQYSYVPTQVIKYPDGRTQKVGEFSSFVKGSFTKVIDEIYDNSRDDDNFIYEVWFITSQLTVYSTDIGEDPRFALETLVRGGGDCEDTAILIADMIRSSSHTKDWEMDLIYFDSDNPTDPQQVNHVALQVEPPNNFYVLETTAKTVEGLNAWGDIKIFGWRTAV